MLSWRWRVSVFEKNLLLKFTALCITNKRPKSYKWKLDNTSTFWHFWKRVSIIDIWSWCRVGGKTLVWEGEACVGGRWRRLVAHSRETRQMLLRGRINSHLLLYSMRGNFFRERADASRMEKEDEQERESLVEQKSLLTVDKVRHTQLHIVKANPVSQVLWLWLDFLVNNEHVWTITLSLPWQLVLIDCWQNHLIT